MNYWILLDIILIAVFVFCVYLVGRNGLVKTLAFLLACAIAAVGAYHLAGRTWKWGAEKIFTPLAEKGVRLVLGDPEESPTYDYLDSVVDTLDKAMEKIKEKLAENADEDEEPESIISISPEEEQEEEESEALSSVEKICGAIGKYASMIILFWIFFALLLALLRLLIDELSFVDRIPIVGRVNQILGILLGVVIGFAILAAPSYVLMKILGEIDLFDTGKLSSSVVITNVTNLLGKIMAR